MTLLQEIEAFLLANSMSATAFGADALNDPPFVAQLRNGRDVKLSTAERVRKFMADPERQKAEVGELGHKRILSGGDAPQSAGKIEEISHRGAAA